MVHFVKSTELFLSVFSVEALYATGRVDQSLLARIIRMTVRAHFNLDLRERRVRLEGIAAGAGDHAAAVIRMDFCSHFSIAKGLTQLS
jgi:hypothetical protein